MSAAGRVAGNPCTGLFPWPSVLQAKEVERPRSVLRRLVGGVILILIGLDAITVQPAVIAMLLPAADVSCRRVPCFPPSGRCRSSAPLVRRPNWRRAVMFRRLEQVGKPRHPMTETASRR